jgi:6-phosphogluconolactonase
MSSPIIRHLADAEQVSRTAAEEFVRLARAATAARGRFTVALSGGSTPKRLFQLLAEAPFREQVDWSKVEFFWGDERSVPPDHQDSNYRMAREALLQKIDAPAGHVHRMQAERTDREAAARDYQAEIARVFGVSPDGEPPVFDLVLLGMGPDAHTASLFPSTTALKETTRWVVPNYVPKFSTYRLTTTPRILNRAAQVMFLVAGADKAGPLVEVLEGPADTERLPSQLIRPTTGLLVWLVDRAAAARLTRTPTAG